MNALEQAHKALSATQRELYLQIERNNKLEKWLTSALTKLLYAQAAIVIAIEDNADAEVSMLRRDFHNLNALVGHNLGKDLTQVLVHVANNARILREVQKALV